MTRLVHLPNQFRSRTLAETSAIHTKLFDLRGEVSIPRCRSEKHLEPGIDTEAGSPESTHAVRNACQVVD